MTNKQVSLIVDVHVDDIINRSGEAFFDELQEVSTSRSKHIDVKFRFIQGLARPGEIRGSARKNGKSPFRYSDGGAVA